VVTLEQPPKEQPLPKKQLPQGNHKGVPLQKKTEKTGTEKTKKTGRY